MCQQEMEVEVTDADEDNEVGGGVINGDCHLLIALFRHCGGKFTVMTCVCVEIQWS